MQHFSNHMTSALVCLVIWLLLVWGLHGWATG